VDAVYVGVENALHNPHGTDIPFFVIYFLHIQTRVFRASPQFFHQTM